MEATLYLVGLGLEPLNHATVESLQALGRCDVVFGQGLDADAQAYLGRFCASLRPAPERGAAEAVLAELAAGHSVGLATPGHPVLWSGLGAELSAACRKGGFTVKSFGAVSAAGVALAAIGKALGDDILGLQAFDWAALAEGRVTANSAVPLAVFFYSPLPEGGAWRLAEALAPAYPAEHPVAWCSTAGFERTVPLKDLAAQLGGVTLKTVLFLDVAVPTVPRHELDPRHRVKGGS